MREKVALPMDWVRKLTHSQGEKAMKYVVFSSFFGHRLGDLEKKNLREEMMAKPEVLIRLEEEITTLENQLSRKENELFETEMKIISEFFGQTVKNIETGYHECKDSPIGICFYDNMEDPALDDCLICGEPDERK